MLRFNTLIEQSLTLDVINLSSTRDVILIAKQPSLHGNRCLQMPLRPVPWILAHVLHVWFTCTYISIIIIVSLMNHDNMVLCVHNLSNTIVTASLLLCETCMEAWVHVSLSSYSV